MQKPSRDTSPTEGSTHTTDPTSRRSSSTDESTVSITSVASDAASETHPELTAARFTNLFRAIDDARVASLYYQEAVNRQNLLRVYQDLLQAIFPENPSMTTPTPTASLDPSYHQALLTINKGTDLDIKLDELQRLRAYARKNLKTFEETLAMAKFCLIFNEALAFVASIDFPAPPIDPIEFQKPIPSDQIYFIYHYFKTVNVLTDVRTAIDIFLAHLSTENLKLIKKNITRIFAYANDPSTRHALPEIILKRHPTLDPCPRDTARTETISDAIASDVNHIQMIAEFIQLGIHAEIKLRKSTKSSTTAPLTQTILDTDFQTQIDHSISAFRRYPSLIPTAYRDMDAATTASFHDRTPRPTLQNIIDNGTPLPTPQNIIFKPVYANPPRYGWHRATTAGIAVTPLREALASTATSVPTPTSGAPAGAASTAGATSSPPTIP